MSDLKTKLKTFYNDHKESVILAGAAVAITGVAIVNQTRRTSVLNNLTKVRIDSVKALNDADLRLNDLQQQVILANAHAYQNMMSLASEKIKSGQKHVSDL